MYALCDGGEAKLKYNEVPDWTALAPGTELDNPSFRSNDHKSTYAEWAYVAAGPSVIKLTFLAFENSPINQRLSVESQNPPNLTSHGFQASVSLVEQGVLVMERGGAVSMAGIILAMTFNENEELAQVALRSHGLELRRV